MVNAPHTPVYQRNPFRKWILSVTAVCLMLLSVDFTVRVLSAMSNADPGPAAAFPVGSKTPGRTRTPLPSMTPKVTPTSEPSLGSQIIALLPLPTSTPLPSPTPTATPKAGTKHTSEIDGMTLVYIPGNKNPDSGTGFWIDRTQVTNAMYASCVKAGICTPPIRKGINPHYYDPAYADHPAVYIVWAQAERYCEWEGGRLPTASEWERAAGGRGRVYAWGDSAPGPQRANVNHYHVSTVKVGSYSNNASHYGVLDLGSNVREWVYDWASPKNHRERMLKGASWYDPPNFSRIDNHLDHDPNSAGDNRGFRCVVLP